MTYSYLFSPIEIGSLKVKNRIVMAPLDAGLHGSGGSMTDRYIDFLVERAKGEVGLIVTEFTAVYPEEPIVTTVIWEDKFIPGFRRLTDEVKEAGARIFMQIAMHGGKAMKPAFAPSSIDTELYNVIPRELTIDEIKMVIEAFVKGAERAKKAGFDGVELHGAHTYLVGQFISPHSNKRNDRYGGDFDGRMRFPSEIVQGIREVCGEDFPVGFKYSAHEHLPGGVNEGYDEGENDDLHVRIAHHMETAGVVYLHVATTSSTILKARGFIECTHPSVPPLYIPPNSLVDLAQDVKKSGVNIPVMATGGITDPLHAEQIIANGKADMVALGRTLIADPYWARKAAKNENIVPCIRCNFCHSFVVMDRGGVQCTVNPVVGREKEYQFKKTKSPKKIIIVGSGPGGLEAGIRAREKGHTVIIFEQRDAIGGEMISASIPDFKWDVKRLLDFYRIEASKDGLDIRLRQPATIETIQEEKPDAVVLALGGEAVIPQIPGITLPHVITAIEALVHWDQKDIGQKVLVLGAGLVGYEVAWYAAQRGRTVTLISRRNEKEVILLKEHGTNRALLAKGVKDAGVQILGNRDMKSVDTGRVILQKSDGEEEIHEVDSLIVSRGYTPRTHLKEAIEKSSLRCDVYEIGDCVKVRNFFDAINEAAALVREVLV